MNLLTHVSYRFMLDSSLLCGLLLLPISPILAQDRSSAESTAQWKTAAPVPRGAEEVIGISAGGKFYMFGGLALDWEPIGMVMEYDTATDKWTRKRDMPAYYHHMAFTQAGGRIYMFGGFSLPKEGKAMWVPVTDSWEYDPQADTWRALAPLSAARGSANAVHVNGRIHLIGGGNFACWLEGRLGSSFAPDCDRDA